MNVFKGLLFLGLSAFILNAKANESPPPHFIPASANEAQWTFSGVVSDENNEQYGYFFQMSRVKNTFYSRSALFDVQTKKILIKDASEAELTPEEAKTNHFHVGHAFLQFNTINDSWVFGFKKPNKAGFNFKVDMLKPQEILPLPQGLKAGIDVLVSQAHSLNGHIIVPDKSHETFVTAKNAWFRQMAITGPLKASHAVKGILCGFNDDSGFYSVNLPEADAIRGAFAGSFNPDGQSVPMSQFIDVESLQSGVWVIRVPSPNQKVVISDFIEGPSVIAGIAEIGDRKGFCVLSEDAVGQSINKQAGKETV